jgi:hypothetical protein
MITLIRPSELICLIIPLTWGLVSWRTVGERLRQAGAWIPLAGLAAAVFALTLLPQLFYWKAVTGYWVYYSYGGVKFDFAHPHIWEGLFSFKNGWLVYTPLMALALVGIVYLGRWREALLPVGLLLPIHIYIIYAWPYWNYLNGLGSRPMVEVYPLLGIPLALLLHAWLGAGRWRLALVPVSLVLIWANQLQTWQTWAGVYFPEDNHRAYFFRMLTRIRPRYEDLVLFDALEVQPDTSRLTRVRQLYADPITDTLRYGRHVVTEPVHSPPYAVYSTDQLPYGPGVNVQADTAGLQPRDWVQAVVWAYRPYTGQDLYRMSYLVVTVEGGGQARVWRAVRLDNKPGNDRHTLWGGSAQVWGPVSLLVRMPDDLAPTDIVKVYVWHPGTRPMYVDDLEVKVWRE